jgi:hypothetical protein
MPVSPFAGDVDPRRSGGPDEPRDAAVRPEMRASPPGEPGGQPVDEMEEMTEEPGYGHGV